jgi:CheY-like chemotaxis protein
MPGLSGGELAAELRQIRPDVPIIMASGYIRSEDRQAAQRLHINQLVYKPNTIEELGQLLSREITALRTRRTMPVESQPAI